MDWRKVLDQREIGAWVAGRSALPVQMGGTISGRTTGMSGVSSKNARARIPYHGASLTATAKPDVVADILGTSRISWASSCTCLTWGKPFQSGIPRWCQLHQPRSSRMFSRFCLPIFHGMPWLHRVIARRRSGQKKCPRSCVKKDCCGALSRRAAARNKKEYASRIQYGVICGSSQQPMPLGHGY